MLNAGPAHTVPLGMLRCIVYVCIGLAGRCGVRCGAATNSSCRGRSGPVITYPVPRTDPTLILLFIAIRVSLSSHTFLLLLLTVLLSLTVCAHSVARMFSCLVTPPCFCCECRDPFNLLFCCSFSYVQFRMRMRNSMVKK